MRRTHFANRRRRAGDQDSHGMDGNLWLIKSAGSGSQLALTCSVMDDGGCFDAEPADETDYAIAMSRDSGSGDDSNDG